jgi:hypothetical protein
MKGNNVLDPVDICDRFYFMMSQEEKEAGGIAFPRPPCIALAPDARWRRGLGSYGVASLLRCY